MLALDEVKNLLGDESLSEEKAEELRNACYSLAELVLDAWEQARTCGASDANDGMASRA